MSRAEIDDALHELAKKHRGRLTPELVVEAAKDKTSPLHGCFNWNVKAAAYQHWLYQARKLIMSVRVEITTTQFAVKAPAYVRDPAAPGGTQGFASLSRLRSDEEMAREAVIAEFSRAASALSRARAVAVALGLADEIEELRGQVLALAERVHPEGPALAA